jgi:Na+/melibiose symporter-like transporter
VATPTLIAAQASVPWNERAVVTGTNMFMRSVGSAVGVAIFGAIVNATLGRSAVETDRVAPGALTTAVHHVFLGTAVLAVAMAIAVLLMPRDRGRAQVPAQETSELTVG